MRIWPIKGRKRLKGNGIAKPKKGRWKSHHNQRIHDFGHSLSLSLPGPLQLVCFFFSFQDPKAEAIVEGRDSRRTCSPWIKLGRADWDFYYTIRFYRGRMKKRYQNLIPLASLHSTNLPVNHSLSPSVKSRDSHAYSSVLIGRY